MKFLCDHDVATDVARVLRARGYAAMELRDELPPDTPDAAVWAHACVQGSILITCNRADFLALQRTRQRIPASSCSFVAVRTRPKPAACSHCWPAPASKASPTTSTSPEGKNALLFPAGIQQRKRVLTSAQLHLCRAVYPARQCLSARCASARETSATSFPANRRRWKQRLRARAP